MDELFACCRWGGFLKSMKTSLRLATLALLVVGLLIATTRAGAADAGFDERAKVKSRYSFADEKAKAEKGDPKAQNAIGAHYWLGSLVEEDYAEAAKWFRKAADQGNLNAQSSLGQLLYEGGKGVEKDYTEAAKWWRKAADQGEADAQFNLGLLYDNGQGVQKDYAEAAKWYRRAADLGRAVAQLNLGMSYYYGKGVEKDYAEAAKWFRKGADQGNAGAQLFLASLYRNGQGVEKDYAKAMKWYRNAADQGLDQAQFGIGGLYFSGHGVERDYAEAYAWFNLAARTDTNAATSRDLLEKQMSPQQVAEAQKRTKELRAMIEAKTKAASK